MLKKLYGRARATLYIEELIKWHEPSRTLEPQVNNVLHQP